MHHRTGDPLTFPVWVERHPFLAASFVLGAFCLLGWLRRGGVRCALAALPVPLDVIPAPLVSPWNPLP